MLVLSPLIAPALNLVQKVSTDGSLWADIVDPGSRVFANTAKNKDKIIDFFILRPSDPIRPLSAVNAVNENFLFE